MRASVMCTLYTCAPTGGQMKDGLVFLVWCGPKLRWDVAVNWFLPFQSVPQPIMNGCWISCRGLGCRGARCVSFSGTSALPAGKQVGVDLSWFICSASVSSFKVKETACVCYLLMFIASRHCSPFLSDHWLIFVMASSSLPTSGTSESKLKFLQVFLSWLSSPKHPRAYCVKYVFSSKIS